PSHQLGTAYAMIFLVQNIGLWGVPVLIGFVLDNYCKLDGGGYDYTLPMCIFTSIAVLSLIVALLLKRADKKYGYNLEEANIKE
ncbi:MAG: MFS transporter, partial [Phocaeicola sp.]